MYIDSFPFTSLLCIFYFTKDYCSKTYIFQTCNQSRRGLSRESVAINNLILFTFISKIAFETLISIQIEYGMNN